MLTIILFCFVEKEENTKGSNAESVSRKLWGANNPIPEKTILEMSGVPKEYKNSYMNSLKGYMCDKCGKKDLGDHTETSDVAGAYLYWLETGNQPFDGAVCTACYVARERTKRLRKQTKKTSL